MTNATYIPADEWNQISRDLAKHHTVFYRFWQVSTPRFSEEIPTAAVSFDRQGECVDFRINPHFWATLTYVQRLFVICHECQHIIYKHGHRAKLLYDSNLSPEDAMRLNIAMDIAVNEGLVERFDFNRAEIDPTNKYIWADKVGTELGITLSPSRCFEYYYNLLKGAGDEKFQPQSGQGGDGAGSPFGETMDDHENGDQTKPGDDADEIIDRIADDMDDSELEALERLTDMEAGNRAKDAQEGGFEAGDHGLGHNYRVKTKYVKPKKKWETVIRKWTEKHLVEDFAEVDQWAKTARRFTMLSPDLMLPFTDEVEELTFKKDKIDVWFFLDVSGSCAHLAERFFTAAKSLPPQRFNVHMHLFDTKVKKIDIKDTSIKVGGGTYFHILEDYVQKHRGEKYPGAVFVITDGFGTDINPELPGRWHWFLSYKYEKCIPPQCKTYMLNDFE